MNYIWHYLKIDSLSKENQALIKKISQMEKKIEDFLGPIDTANIKLRNIKASEVADTETNNYTIGKVLDSVLLQKQAINTENYQTAKTR